jgi:hypothetical protein
VFGNLIFSREKEREREREMRFTFELGICVNDGYKRGNSLIMKGMLNNGVLKKS